mmetsp:Transcript_18801/g.33764  ORF Transcript_18801/g.33764 Transcript_18801/m.33764 type:complete len:641 (+) Transcript_18801:422-2344(+)
MTTWGLPLKLGGTFELLWTSLFAILLQQCKVQYTTTSYSLPFEVFTFYPTHGASGITPHLHYQPCNPAAPTTTDDNVLDTVDDSTGGDEMADETEEEESDTNTADLDSDGDGLTDEIESNELNTDPLDSDTDADGLSDYNEVMIHGTNPLDADTDGDNLNDAFEIDNGLDPLTSNTAMGDALAVSPGCDAWMREEVYETSVPARVDFLYEVAIDENVDLDEVSDGLEESMARLVGRDLIKCELLDDRRRRLEGGTSTVLGRYYGNNHHQRHLLVDGIDPAPPDIVTQRTCTYYTSDNPATPPNSYCYVVQGLMTLYLRENSSLSSTSESSTKALKALLTAMNEEDPSPFAEGGDRFGVAGIKGLRYVQGTPDEGGMNLIDNSGGDGMSEVTGNVPDTSGIAQALESQNSDSDVDDLSPVGIILIALGSVGIIGVALVAARSVRRQRKDPMEIEQYAEFSDGEDDDLDEIMKDGDTDARTDVDTSSLRGTPSPPKERRHMEYYDNEEEESIFAGLETVTSAETPIEVPMRGGPGPSGFTPNSNATSNYDPQFVHTHHHDDASIAMTAEVGYEFGYDSAMVTPSGGESVRSSPYHQRTVAPMEFRPKVPLESPRYVNPSNLLRQSLPRRNGRGGYVGDTVEL